MDDHIVKASFQGLLDQSTETAKLYLGKAHQAIDKEFGDGYAVANPDLVAAYMKVAASDFNTASMAKVIGASLSQLTDELNSAATQICEELNSIAASL